MNEKGSADKSWAFEMWFHLWFYNITFYGRENPDDILFPFSPFISSNVKLHLVVNCGSRKQMFLFFTCCSSSSSSGPLQFTFNPFYCRMLVEKPRVKRKRIKSWEEKTETKAIKQIIIVITIECCCADGEKMTKQYATRRLHAMVTNLRTRNQILSMLFFCL